MSLTHEQDHLPKPYQPHIEYAQGVDLSAVVDPPADLRQRFDTATAQVYPRELIEKMLNDGYDPVVIGYRHTAFAGAEAVIRKLAELKGTGSNPISVLQEVDPQQVQSIREFLANEAEYQAHGTVQNGKPVDAHMLKSLHTYRAKLRDKDGEWITLWCLENGVEVNSITHPDLNSWAEQDAERFSGDNKWMADDVPALLQRALKDDLYGLSLIEQKRPDVISVGEFHALKYDLLLHRSGEKSFYYQALPVRWEQLLCDEEEAHTKFKAVT